MKKQQPKYLGSSHTEAITADQLDTVPWTGPRDMVVRLECSEFTSHCPVTGQPDFATLEIEYVPRDRLVETKSMKLYLWSFREARSFNEELVATIAREFARAVRPRVVTVRGHFAIRGGISVHPTCTVRGRK